DAGLQVWGRAENDRAPCNPPPEDGLTIDRREEASRGGGSFVKPMRLELVGVSPQSGAHMMVLREADGDRALVMGIGAAEALAIAAGAGKIERPRPLTHDLLKHLLDRVEVRVTSVIVHDVRDDAFIASLEIDTPQGIHEVVCRPSDGVALALRFDAPIYAEEKVLEQSGIDIASITRSDGDDDSWID